MELNVAQEKGTGFGSVEQLVQIAGTNPALSEMEFALVMAQNAFSRWLVRCAAAVGAPGLTPLDVMVMHMAKHRGRAKTLADMCLLLNIEDTHLVAYAIKKLERQGLVRSGKQGKEKTVEATPKGSDVCTEFAEVRDKLLIEALETLGLDHNKVSELSDLLRALSGQYDQAARTAASL